MRPLLTSIAVVTLAASFVIAPTVTSGAAPRPVAPVIHDIAIPSLPGASMGARSTTVPGARAGTTVVAAKQIQGVDFDLAGLTFDAAPPAGTDVKVRTHGAAGWSGWTDLKVNEEDVDPGSADARHARPGTDAIAAADSDAIDIRVTTPDGSLPRGLRASLVDGGRSSADAITPAGSAVAAVTRPTIITRAQWGADESLRTCDPEQLSGFKAVVVHHTVNSNTYSATQAASLVRSIYAYHTQSLGWCDVGYQILVDRFGRAYEGRKGSTTGFVQGAQTGGFNTETTAVSVIGDYTSIPFSAATLSTVTKLVAWEADRSRFDPTSSVMLTSAGNSKYAAGRQVTLSRTLGHRDLGLTACPGNTAYTQLPTIRRNAGTIWRSGQTPAWTPEQPVTATETYPRPPASTYALSGRGFGHGIGMSQWGAYGAATQYLTWQQILAFYYPGTVRTTQADPTLRVWLSAVGTSGVSFARLSGLVVSDGKRNSALSTAHRWRVVPQGSTLTLQANSGSGWFTATNWGRSTLPLTVSRPSNPSVRVILPSGAQREYAGSVRVSNVSGKAYAVNLVGTERYTRAVVPLEMSPSWPAAALSAQSVAARTFAANARAGAGSRVYDTCDVACQAYKGVADYTSAGSLTRRYEDSRSTNATSATAGVVLTFGGKPAFTQYSASNGGRSVSGSASYLPAKDDPYDGVVASAANPDTWTASLSAASVERAFPTTGTLRSLSIDSRTGGGGAGTWGGRVASVTVNGSTGASTVSGDTFRARLGLRSTWWTVTSAPARSASFSPRDVTGDSLPDAIVPAGSALRTISYTGTMGFGTKQILPSGFTGMRAAAAVGPWSQDSLGDVVAIDASGTAWYYPGLGTAGLDAGRYQLATGWGSVNLVIPVGDWNGDGKTDIATRMTDGRLILRTGDGTGRIVSSPTIGTGWSGMSQITSGEYTGDGRRDLVAVRVKDGALVLYPGTGAGGFKPAVVAGHSGWNSMSAVRGIGDLTGDGRDDVLARRSSDGALLVYPVAGSARFSSPIKAGTYASTAAWGQ